MNSRLWYPQLDVYDAIRRICLILQCFEDSPGMERLYMSDFFLANPPLLYRTSMSAEIRKSFMVLKIPRPNKTFISYPSSLLLFHKMEPIQKEAINALKGKGLLSLDDFERGTVKLAEKADSLFPIEKMCTPEERNLCVFLATIFSNSTEINSQELRRKTGLRRSI
jgi:hypothetical protein